MILMLQVTVKQQSVYFVDLQLLAGI